MKDSRSVPLRPDLLWVLVVLLFLAAVPHLIRVDPAISAFFGVMMLLRIVGSFWSRLLPGRPLLVIATLAGLGNVFLHYPLLFGRRAGVALLISMSALKLLEARTQRDIYVGIFLGYFMLITLFLFSQSIQLALYGMLIVTALTALMVEASRCSRSRSPADSLRTAGNMVLQALPIMIALFFFFPRLSSPLWELGYETPTSSTGISDTLSPGSMGNLIQDQSVAFRADFEGEIPRPEKRYWRGLVFWQTDGRDWRDDRTIRQPFNSPGNISDVVGYSVILEPTGRPWLFTLDLPLGAPAKSHLSGDFQLVSDHSGNRKRNYRVQSALEYNTGSIHAFDRRYALQLPDNITIRMRELVADWRLEANSDLELVNSALDFFRKEPFYYTLTPPLLDKNPADQFLFESRRGFCEHFATSFTLLMRIAGIPSRVVGGYQGGEVNPLGNYLTVRQSDAHAWSEVWLSGRGWVRVDPTAAVAPERVERSFRITRGQLNQEAGEPVDFGIEPELMERIRRQISWGVDALSTSWHRWVLGYSSSRQSEFMRLIGLDFLEGRRLAFGMILLTASIISVIGVVLWLKTVPRVDRIQSAYLRFCRKMEAVGIPRHPSEGPIHYRKRILTKRPDLRTEIEGIIQAYVKLRYAPPEPGIERTDYFRSIRRFSP